MFRKILLLRECVTVKDEKTEKPLAVAVIGGGVFLCTKKLYNLFTCCRSSMEGNVRESHNARNVICGGGVFLCTKKLYNLFTCCRSRMEGNVRESHNA